jgi:exopolysaccharide production protein ExoY
MLSRLIAGLLLICLFPFIFIIGFIIKLKYPGPIFFRQIREGKNSRQFHIWKLRTMVANADTVLKQLIKNDNTLAEEWRDYGGFKKDPRITGAVGRLARRLSIDELPQLINIINGDMAFVGPRPLEMYLAEALTPQDKLIRNSVKPGLTGLWQIGQRSNVTIKQMQHYDKLYVLKKSFCLDTYILFKTVIVVFNKTGV